MKLLRDKRETLYAYDINNSPNSGKTKKYLLILSLKIFMKT